MAADSFVMLDAEMDEIDGAVVSDDGDAVVANDELAVA